MRAMKFTLTGLIVANAVLAVLLLSGGLHHNTAEAGVVDRGGEYVAVTGMISSTREALYLINTREDRMCVFFWAESYKRLDKLANVDLRVEFATQAAER